MASLRPLIISAPFGNYLTAPNATSTLGTFTVRRRGGLLYRLWRVLRTVRHSPRQGSWINRLGLPNPGISSLLPPRTYAAHVDYTDEIISVHGFGRGDWDELARVLTSDLPYCLHVELNLSCPNTGEDYTHIVDDVRSAATSLLRSNRVVIAKLPPVRWMGLASPLYDLGVRYFHCCNTIPTPNGGVGGKPLKPFSLWAVSDLKRRWGRDVKVIGGGGVTGAADVRDYLEAGADHVAVASALFNPLNWRRMRSWTVA